MTQEETKESKALPHLPSLWSRQMWLLPCVTVLSVSIQFWGHRTGISQFWKSYWSLGSPRISSICQINPWTVYFHTTCIENMKPSLLKLSSLDLPNNSAPQFRQGPGTVKRLENSVTLEQMKNQCVPCGGWVLVTVILHSYRSGLDFRVLKVALKIKWYLLASSLGYVFFGSPEIQLFCLFWVKTYLSVRMTSPLKW